MATRGEMLAAIACALLASRAAAEWVEIAQTHYRKEPARRVTSGSGEANRIYLNYTITERAWHRDDVRIPNVGNVQRVHSPNADDQLENVFNFKRSSPHEIIRNRYEDIGPVRAPSIREKDVNRIPYADDEITEDFERSEDPKRIHGIPTRDFKTDVQKIYSITPNVLKEIVKTGHNNEFHELKPSKDHGHTITLSEYKTSQSKSNTKLIQSDSDRSDVKAVEVVKEADVGLKLTSQEGSGKVNSKGRIKETHGVINLNKSSNLSTAEANKSSSSKDKLIERDNSLNINTQEFNNKEKLKQSIDDRDVNEIKSANNKNVEAIWKLMKVITDNISRNTRRSFRSKVRYLEDLRNNLLANIEQRIEQAWPAEPRGSARARARREARGHVEFPSSESALMTISFLTFAVFLIKLVLQVIHTYKNKTMMMTPALVAAVGRVAQRRTDPSSLH